MLAAAGLGMTVTAFAAELEKVDRSIAKEPTYESAQPKYCLVVFGRKADRRVWLVQDGNVLFVDRNGNGDLTEEGERLALGEKPAFRRYETELMRAADEKGEKETLSLYYFTDSPTIYLETAELRQSAGSDANGELVFADQPEHAPVIHFGGPLTMSLDQPYTLDRGSEPTRVYATVGTAGLGPGSFASITYYHIERTLVPQMRVEFPSPNGGQPIVGEYWFMFRC